MSDVHGGGAPAVIADDAGAATRRVRASSDGLDAAKYGRRLSSFVPSAQHINTLTRASGSTVTARARYLRRNNGYVKSATEAWKGDVIGTGFVPIVDDDALKALWNRWTWDADAEGLSDFEGILRRVADEVFVAGECFIRRRPRLPQDGLEVPVQLQMLPSEQCPAHWSETRPNGNEVIQGIEYDKNVKDRRVAYWFYRGNPTDATSATVNTSDLVRVEAKNVIHVFDPTESGQRRGVCQFAAGIVPAWLIDVFEDAELDRKKVASLHAYFFSRPDLPNADDQSEVQAPDAIDLAPGSTVTLPPGWTATPSIPADVGGSFEAFMFRALLRLSAALGVPYPLVTGDFSKVNFSSIRAQFTAYRRRAEAFQHAVVVFQLCRTAWRWFIEAAAMAGRPEVSSRLSELPALLNRQWQPPKWEWTDPAKDAKAEQVAVDNHFKALSTVWESLGEDPASMKAKIEADLAWKKDMRDKGYLVNDKSVIGQAGEHTQDDENSGSDGRGKNA